MSQRFFSILILLFSGVSVLQAQMRITEYMYTGAGEEFIEFTNIGNTTIDMTGWSYDDSSQSPGVFSLSGFGMVDPGESVIITEDNASDFRTDWSLDASVKVLGGYQNNLGRNDEINLYDNNDVLVDQLTYGDEDFPGTIRTNDVSGWTTDANLGNNDISTWVLSAVNDVQNSYASSNGDIGNPGIYNIFTEDQLAIWTFDALSDVCSGTKLEPTTEDAVGTPYLQQFFQEIDDNGKGGIAYTDVEGVSHAAGKAIAWDDIKGSGDDAELWITLSTRYWSDLSIRFDYRIDDEASGDEVPFDLEFSTDGGFNWTDTSNDVELIDDDEYFTANINLSGFDALEDQAFVILRFSNFDDESNNEFRFDNIEITGVKTAPDPNAPEIAVNSTTTNFLDLNEAGGGFVSAVINDPTDPAQTLGIDFMLVDANTMATSLTVTATSSNQAVVTDANLTLTGTGGSRNLTILPTGVGYTDITVEVSDGAFTDYYLIKYAASDQLSNTSFCHTGASDASTAIALNDDYMLVANDEDEVIRLYDRNNSGLPVNTFDFTKDLELDGKPREVDIEASVQVGNRIYWLASHSNSSEGEERPNRSRLFATDISGSGASATLNFAGYYQYLKEDLIEWDENDDHGLGADFFGLAASAADGVLPEGSNGFNIEGLAMAPGSSTTAYIAFRAPQASASDRTKALIVPVTNFPDLLGANEGESVFGDPIQLDLGGRGIRSLSSNDDDEYIILAGPAGSAGAAPDDFQLYYWDGDAATAPLMIDVTPGLGTGISFESIVDLPTPLANGDMIQLIADNGDNDWYGDGNRSKDLPQANYQKSCSGYFTLDLCAIDATNPIAMCNSFTIQLDANGMASITTDEVDNNSTDECGIASLALSQEDFTCSNLGTNTITLTVTDENGNSDDCDATITVEDNIAPTALCNSFAVQLNADGMASITTNEVDNNSTDNCEIFSYILSQESFVCNDLGANTVTLTVTDESGNSSNCAATITVEDNIAPSAVCLNTTVAIQPDGTYTLLESDVFDDINSSDNCGITDVNFPATTYTCDEAYMNFVVPVTVSDEAGNIDNCTASIFVEVGDALPNGWTATDIGVVTLGNDYAFDPCTAPNPEDGEYTITGSGNNATSSTTDNVAFAGMSLCGDGMITAKIENISPNGYGGLMLRETTAAGSKQVSVFSNLTYILRHEARYTTNGPKQVNAFFKPAPTWLRLQRMGDWVFTYYSNNGVTFQYVHGVFVPMQHCLEIGLASFTYLPSAQTEAVFSNVEVTGSNGGMTAGVNQTTNMSVLQNHSIEPHLGNSVMPHNMHLFPNPAKEQFTLQLDQALDTNAEVLLLDQYGKLITRRQIQAGTPMIEWNTAQLAAGTYILKLTTASGLMTTTKRLIVVK